MKLQPVVATDASVRAIELAQASHRAAMGTQPLVSHMPLQQAITATDLGGQAARAVPGTRRSASCRPWRRQFVAKQYSSPAPPVLTSLGWLQPRLAWAEFQEALPPPVRSKWPSWTEPSSAPEL